MKFCTDCRHYLRPEHVQPESEYGRCGSPRNDLGPSPVDGTPMRVLIYCKSLRELPVYRTANTAIPLCGPDGDWHEQLGL